MKTNQTVRRHRLPLVFLFSFIVLAASCGKNPQNQIVKDVALKTTLEDGKVHITASAQFKLGPLVLPSITLPIIDPKEPGTNYGLISFKPTLQAGFNEIALKLNLSKAARVEGKVPTLPNGASLPVGGINDKRIVELGIDQIHSKIYLGLDGDLTLLGFAIGIKEFDVLNDYLGGTQFFLGFDIKGVLGMVGFFTGNQAYESGLGFFVDMSSVINTDMLNDLINPKKPKTENFFGVHSLALSTAYYQVVDQSPVVQLKEAKSSQERINMARIRLAGEKLSGKKQRKFGRAVGRLYDEGPYLNFVEN